MSEIILSGGRFGGEVVELEDGTDEITRTDENDVVWTYSRAGVEGHGQAVLISYAAGG